MTAEETNGAVLRRLIEKAGMTQLEALELVNVGQAKPMAIKPSKFLNRCLLQHKPKGGTKRLQSTHRAQRSSVW
ncbi:TPA: hypothetical protein MXU26_001550 [Pseudomonas aeruginosa]|nr:hypothetical protein [Pseudomonas aeruginosa]HCA6405229.1 hypothetical protein [Pseudomonas aeruginosa]HCA6412774.1 hypothetical protein [Pseudomonas aeruginosa]HCA6594612.1 hypothetical protein [Pseudomonas aeruginosa]HCA6672388.1 hypothetical protein [Pseudomonas aeruginosa]